MQRYFIKHSQINDQVVKIHEGDYHHMKNVMRFKSGDKVIVNTNDGQVFMCEIVEFQKSVVVLRILKQLSSKINHFNLDLGLSLIKKDHFEFALKKATELGVLGIIPIETERSVVKIKDFEKKKERFSLICKESSEQSERTTLPIIYDLQTINTLDLDKYDHLFVAFARETNKQLKTYFNQIKANEHTLILVGPEGGFSDKEINLLIKKGFKTISLGNTILRAETAAIYITSIFRYMLGE